MKPLIIVNFKTYNEASGDNGLKLAEICEGLSNKKNVKIAVAPQVADIHRIYSNVKIPVISQTVDEIYDGRNTGKILARNVRNAGAQGTLINHSECRKYLTEIRNIIEICRDLDLVTFCCAGDPSSAEEFAAFSPDYIAIEPPELIGTGKSVSTVDPQIVTDTIKLVNGVNPDIPILCGAGISTAEDVKKAFELGVYGVIVSSAVVKAKDQRKKLAELVESFD